MRLTDAQARAIERVRSCARHHQAPARARLEAMLGGSIDIDRVMDAIRARVRITINFHPDRILPGEGGTVAEGLLRHGRYRSQFETAVTNGSKTAFPGGDRDRWEEQLFQGAYHGPEIRVEERPKYGALDLLGHGDGASPRFGSAHLVLRADVHQRATFTARDSYESPEDAGTIDTFEAVLAPFLEAVEKQGRDLWSAGGAAPLIERLGSLANESAAQGAALGRALDDYVEAQVHGNVDLATDVEALVVDPSFRGTEIEACLEAAAARYGFELRHHAGFRLPVADVSDTFRGPRMPELASRVDARFSEDGGVIDAASIGRAARSLALEPDAWSDWGTFEETLQHLKQLWHVLVRFGAPAGT